MLMISETLNEALHAWSAPNVVFRTSCKHVVSWSACNIANFRKFYMVRKRSAFWHFEILKCEKSQTRNKCQWLHAYNGS